MGTRGQDRGPGASARGAGRSTRWRSSGRNPGPRDLPWDAGTVVPLSSTQRVRGRIGPRPGRPGGGCPRGNAPPPAELGARGSAGPGFGSWPDQDSGEGLRSRGDVRRPGGRSSEGAGKVIRDAAKFQRKPRKVKSGAGWIRGQSTRRRIIGVPTGARNTGKGAPTGDQSAGTNRTPKPPAVSQENVTTGFPVAVRKPASVPREDGRRRPPGRSARALRWRRSRRRRGARRRRPP